MTSNVYSEKYRRFLDNLRRARLEAGLSQAEVASIFQKPQSYISKCESGERRIDVVELMEFAKLYKKTLYEFLE